MNFFLRCWNKLTATACWKWLVDQFSDDRYVAQHRKALWLLVKNLRLLNKGMDSMATKQDLLNAVAALKNADPANAQLIADLRAQVASSNDQLSAAQGQLAASQAQVTDLQGQVASLNDQLTAATTIDDSIINDINKVTADITPPTT